MQANELRIGNFIEKSLKSGNGRKLINQIGYQVLVRIFENTGSFNYEPIPLTEEWLLKMGFEINSNISYKITNNNFEIDIMFNDSNEINDIQLSSTNISGAYPNVKNFKYVHQLQNLYFALTGTELELKQL